MINFYHKFLPNIVNTQASLQEMLKGQKKNSHAPVDWTLDKEAAFK